MVHQLEEQSSFILGVSVCNVAKFGYTVITPLLCLQCDEVTKRKNKLIDGRVRTGIMG